MLELTKVINELKDVLIQQVNTLNSFSEATLITPDLSTASKHVCLTTFQVKETSFLRNTISECQACGKTITSLVKMMLNDYIKKCNK